MALKEGVCAIRYAAHYIVKAVPSNTNTSDGLVKDSTKGYVGDLRSDGLRFRRATHTPVSMTSQDFPGAAGLDGPTPVVRKPGQRRGRNLVPASEWRGVMRGQLGGVLLALHSASFADSARVGACAG